jgi:hypothetical protein
MDTERGMGGNDAEKTGNARESTAASLGDGNIMVEERTFSRSISQLRKKCEGRSCSCEKKVIDAEK